MLLQVSKREEPFPHWRDHYIAINFLPEVLFNACSLSSLPLTKFSSARPCGFILCQAIPCLLKEQPLQKVLKSHSKFGQQFCRWFKLKDLNRLPYNVLDVTALKCSPSDLMKQNLIDTQLFKKFSAFHGTRKAIAVFSGGIAITNP